MVSPNEFWLGLHNLAETHDSEGFSPKHRRENIADQFRQMPALAQREFLADLVRMADDLRKIQPLVTMIAQEAESMAVVRLMTSDDVA